jgi:protein-serine/threonine kinase
MLAEWSPRRLCKVSSAGAARHSLVQRPAMAASPISSPFPFSMANRPSRPLPTPPGPVNPLDHIYSPAYSYRAPLPRPEYRTTGPSFPVDEEQPAATLRGGTLLHKGFYDLLALIPTPSPSRILWGAGADPPPPDVVAGPRYEDLPGSNNAPSVNFAPPAVSLPSPGPVSSKKARRISKDMVSKPTGFMYVHDHCTSPSLSLNSNQPFSACI